MQRPSFIEHWTALEYPDNEHYPGDSELMGIGAPLARKLGLKRIGIHHIRLSPGAVLHTLTQKAQRKSLCMCSRERRMCGSTATCIS